jgi:hypothetical protein
MVPALLLWPLVPLLDRADVPRLHALLTAGRLVGDLGTLIERFEAVATYTAVMYEEVVASVVGLDEAVALLVVEPLDRSAGHVLEPTFLSLG